MQPRRRGLLVAIGVLLLLFGLGCLNYIEDTEASRNLFRIGLVYNVSGAGLAGYGLARTRGNAHSPS